MRVSAVNSTNNQQNFSAKIYKTKELKEYFEYVNKFKDVTGNFHNTRLELNLMNHIMDAFEKHPSEATLYPGIYYRVGELFCARGTIDSSKGTKIQDVEPARSDSGTAPLENLFRKILAPENNDMLDTLLGKEHSETTKVWYKENIEPVWNNIDKAFRENIYIEEFDREKLNKAFRKENGMDKKLENLQEKPENVSFIDRVLKTFGLQRISK